MTSKYGADRRIPVYPETQLMLKKLCPKTVTYDTFLRALVNFINTNGIPADTILDNKPIMWVHKEPLRKLNPVIE